METQRMKILKESSTTTTLEDSPDQNQLSEEEKEMERENKAMDEVLSIPLVVEETMEYLKLKELKNCRRVCSMWRETATKVILKKDWSQINLDYYHEPEKTITELTDVVKKSAQFLCSTIVVDDESLEVSELLNFFEVAGSGVKTLILRSVRNVSLENFRQILEVHCPNLEALKIGLAYFQWTEDIKFELSKLKVLSVFYDTEGYKEAMKILRSINTPNLELIEDFDFPDDTMEVVKARKVHTVKELNLFGRTYGTDNENPAPELLQAFVSAGPRIEVLTFEYYYWISVDEDWRIDFAGPFQQLLDTCKDTLKVFKFSGLGSPFANLKFPRFSQLKEMKIYDADRNHMRVFPIRINLADTFPNLKIFDVARVNLSEDNNWDKYFPPPDAYRGQLTSVTTVKVRVSCTQKCQDLIGLMCPNAMIEYV